MKGKAIITIVCILLIGEVVNIMINTQKSKELDSVSQGWMSWYNSLSSEEQNSISYVPSELQSVLGTNDKSKEIISLDILSKETREWLKWYGGLSAEEQSTISYVPNELQRNFINSEVYDAPTGNTKPK